MKKSYIIFILIAIISVFIFISCEEQPTEPVRENILDGNNPDFVPQVSNVTVGYGGDQAENPVPIKIAINGAPGAITQMQIGQVDNSGADLNVSWQEFDSTMTMNFTGTLGIKWLAARVLGLNGRESTTFYKSFTLGMNAPSGLVVSSSETEIILTWQDDSNVETGYKIERKTGVGGTYSQIDTTIENVETYTDSGLNPGTYYYQVRAYNSQGNSGYSGEASASATFNAPTNLTASLISLTEIGLIWQDNSNVEMGYKIERKTGAGGNWSVIFTSASNVESYTNTGLTENTTYYYRICAYSGLLYSDYSNEADATTTYIAGSQQTFDLGTTGLTIDMVWIPSGSFMQGRYSGEQGSSSVEDPSHLVTLDYGFWLGKYEVTQAQWEAVAGSWSFGFDNHPDYPAEKVSWDDIVNTFLPTLNSQTGSNVWRLPSESEWEYACRAGTTTRFYWGDDLSETQIGIYAWYSGNSSSTTHTVGTRQPNAWNLHDMSGNVWEWCEDYWHYDYTGAPADGSPWLSPSSSYRVLRGGSWYNYPNYCRSAARGGSSPDCRYDNCGFRLARSS